MKIGFTSFWLLLLFLGGACTSQKEVTSISNPTRSNSLSDTTTIIKFVQTGCLGTCPVHVMQIRANGTATYQGDRHVKNVGTFTYNFSSQQMEEILEKAQALGFFQLDSNYTDLRTDFPLTTVFVKIGNQSHHVKAYGTYPDNLKEFIAYLFAISQNTPWVETPK